MAYDINYKTISKKDQLRMIRNKYKESVTELEKSIIEEILGDVFNWDAVNDCSY